MDDDTGIAFSGENDAATLDPTDEAFWTAVILIAAIAYMLGVGKVFKRVIQKVTP